MVSKQSKGVTTSCYPSQHWPKSMSPYGITRLPWVKPKFLWHQNSFSVKNPILPQFCTEQGSTTALHCAKFEEDSSTKKELWANDILQNLADFRQIINIVTRLRHWPYSVHPKDYTHYLCLFFQFVVLGSSVMSHEHHGISNHWQLDCLSNSLFRITSQKTSKLCITDPLWGESTTGDLSKRFHMLSLWTHVTNPQMHQTNIPQCTIL